MRATHDVTYENKQHMRAFIINFIINKVNSRIRVRIRNTIDELMALNDPQDLRDF